MEYYTYDFPRVMGVISPSSFLDLTKKGAAAAARESATERAATHCGDPLMLTDKQLFWQDGRFLLTFQPAADQLGPLLNQFACAQEQ